MIGYILRRLLQAIVVVLVVTVIVFILLHQLPGGAARAILGPRATDLQITEFNLQNGYDKPLIVQYFHQLGQWLTGNFGFSIKLNQSVSSLLVQRMPKTIILGLLSLVLTVVVAVPLGILQAVRRNKPFDYIATGLAFVFYAAPTFFIGLIMIEIFSQQLGWFPPEAPQANGVVPIFAQFDAMVLPIVTLALLSIAGFSRYMRSSVLDNVDQDYVRTAKAKGAGPTRVLYHHVLRNALIPIITLLGLSIPAVFAGALITESIFNFPGMGLLFWQAAQASDYPVELGVVMITAFATVTGNLLADISLAVLDPRVKL
ncbi:ABC transporter permease [Paeniglutamicibacter cryotolerans]|uniref:Peptide/nickel transport system permease protein n=1 Tax=Paeniglutamicibacter cryotolerans TaxID=670079 RepID=A0A839QYH8_9MICC|nr:ABC transporter permease [Paeniglutamicibacter cryotolerans]MBB2997011.1 peptide/nickel transport system permease protein [Paeniglutamicibacter cryotolerans]